MVEVQISISPFRQWGALTLKLCARKATRLGTALARVRSTVGSIDDHALSRRKFERFSPLEEEDEITTGRATVCATTSSSQFT